MNDAADTYTADGRFDDLSQPYTAEELVELDRHWGGSGNLDFLADGRVIRASGDVIATRNVPA